MDNALRGLIEEDAPGDALLFSNREERIKARGINDGELTTVNAASAAGYFHGSAGIVGDGDIMAG